MRLKDLFEKWGLTGLKVKTPILEMDWEPSDPDKNAAWDLYVELLTRITTQKLPDEYGTEAAALKSVYKIFELTRTTLKQHGRKAENFTRIAIIVLNQVIRPFTAKWHQLSEQGAFGKEEKCIEFRKELAELQVKLRAYTKMLSELADVEDMTDMEDY
ncbi:MAG TPA: hypothetical protein ENK44_10885 [Caldithrix abyssi]|uniref:Uncharacterized protein n=1 Tax=Caldithrix abyssi TaxID=187145 RepID=A0A7V4U1C4_CALAY|nr:hypothetical protein [Caldithrix abyssi]